MVFRVSFAGGSTSTGICVSVCVPASSVCCCSLEHGRLHRSAQEHGALVYTTAAAAAIATVVAASSRSSRSSSSSSSDSGCDSSSSTTLLPLLLVILLELLLLLLLLLPLLLLLLLPQLLQPTDGCIFQHKNMVRMETLRGKQAFWQNLQVFLVVVNQACWKNLQISLSFIQVS